MRVLRKIFGIVGVVVGLPLLIAGATGWFAAGHRDVNGAFTAELAPVHSSGYAVVVPDVAALLGRHGAAKWLRPGRLRVTVAAEPRPVVAMIMRAEVARGYLDGVARTEVTAVGFATGAQPVRLTDIEGTSTPAPAPDLRALASGTDVVWDPAAATEPLSLVVMRADGEPDLDATLTVGIRSAWLEPLARGLSLGGTAVLLAGWVALLWRPREEKRAAGGDAPLAVPKPRFDVTTDVDSYPVGGWDPGTEAAEQSWDYPADEGEQMTHDDYNEGYIDLDGDALEPDEPGGMVRAAATRARRWSELLRSRGRTNPVGRHAFGASGSSVDSAPAGFDVDARELAEDDEQRRHDLPNGESPYIYTAT